MSDSEITSWTYDEDGRLERTSDCSAGALTNDGLETKLWVFKTGTHEVWVRWCVSENGPEVVNSVAVEQPSFGRAGVPFFAVDRRPANG